MWQNQNWFKRGFEWHSTWWLSAATNWKYILLTLVGQWEGIVPCRLSSKHMSKSSSGHCWCFARCHGAWRTLQAPPAGHTSGGAGARHTRSPTWLCDCYQKSAGPPDCPAHSCSMLGQTVCPGKPHKLFRKNHTDRTNINPRLSGDLGKAYLHCRNSASCTWGSRPSLHIVKQPLERPTLLFLVWQSCPHLPDTACSNTCCCGWHVALECISKSTGLVMIYWKRAWTVTLNYKP